jgi:hypothetical protein
MDTEADFVVDGVRTRVVYQPHEGRHYIERTHVARDAILEANAKMRQYAQDVKRDMVWALQADALEFYDYVAKHHPEYHTASGNERKAILMKILAARPEWGVRPGSKF